MATIELFVSLKIPDSVAMIALNTIKNMKYKIKKLERSVYYKFDVKGDVNAFKSKISNTDILVNSNKNKFSFSLDNKGINILVQDIDSGSSLLSTLKERLGFDNIKKLEKGTLWTMVFDKNTKKIAVDITKNLLMNENYQKYKVI